MEFWAPWAGEAACTIPPLPPMLDFSYYNVGLNFVRDRVVACHLTTCVGLGLFGWEKIADTVYVRTDASSSVLQGKVLLAGGEVGSDTTELVDVEKGVSEESFPLVPGRFWHCAIQLSESAVVMTGGLERSGGGAVKVAVAKIQINKTKTFFL